MCTTTILSLEKFHPQHLQKKGKKKKAMGEDETPGISAENFESIQHLSKLKTAIKINSTCIKHEGSGGCRQHLERINYPFYYRDTRAGDEEGGGREDTASEIPPSLVTLNWIQKPKNNCRIWNIKMGGTH